MVSINDSFNKIVRFFVKSFVCKDNSDVDTNKHDIDEPQHDTVVPSLCAALSDTEKTLNQDACGYFSDNKTGITVVAVADGIGSSKHAEVGSRFVVNKALEIIASNLQDGKKFFDYTDIFAKIQEQLTEMVNRDFADHLESVGRKDFGTTLIVGVDYPEMFTLAYLGNGCAYYLTGDYTKFPSKGNYLPWRVNNLLLPHSLPDENTGQEALYKYFSYHLATADQCVPTVITVSKNHHSGEIFIIATDGVDSLDKHDEFVFYHDELMMTSSWKAHLLCESLKSVLEKTTAVDLESLNQMLKDYMMVLKKENRMDDDTTLAIIMSQKKF